MSDSEQPRTMITLAEAVELYRAMRCLETALAAHDLTVFQLALLSSLAAHPDAPIGTNARRLGIDPATTTSGVNRLEKRGLVMRRTSSDAGKPRDRRYVLVDVTERGRETLAALATIALPPMDEAQERSG